MRGSGAPPGLGFYTFGDSYTLFILGSILCATVTHFYGGAPDPWFWRPPEQGMTKNTM